MTNAKIGLLPLYLELYDTAMPECRQGAERFRDDIVGALRQRGLAVLTAPPCRRRTEFEAALRTFEAARVDALVTLHLAYSPSLESAAALAGTSLPLLVLDTTPDHDFGPGQDPDMIMYNHGIHGVQDMCNMLLRNGKKFSIHAGHWQRSDVLDRLCAGIRGAQLAAALRRTRVGRIGPTFAGMGDFTVPEDVLAAKLGVQVIGVGAEALAALTPTDNDAVAAELAADAARFDVTGLDSAVHRRSARAGLALRRWLEMERLDAFSMNFLAFTAAAGVPVVPFLEASKAMARGTGYAGEGDVLTAALVHALATVYPRTTFTEMFCPDWRGNSVFLSHMGEVNVDLVAGRARLVERPFPWTDANNPVAALGALQAGAATFVNLAPGADDAFTLIAAAGEMLAVPADDRMAETIHGWFKPDVDLADFLEIYSQAGGTHHAALVYGAALDELEAFGRHMGWNTLAIL